MLWKKIGIGAGVLASIATVGGVLVKGSGGSVTQTASTGGVNVSQSQGVTINTTPTLTKVAATASNRELAFLFGTWCSQIGGRTTFRAVGETIEHRFISPGNPQFRLPSVDTGWERPRMLFVTFPTVNWILTKDNADGSQSQYTKESNFQMSLRATDTGDHVVTLSKCQ